jgi:hypothetical protein
MSQKPSILKTKPKTKSCGHVAGAYVCKIPLQKLNHWRQQQANKVRISVLFLEG